MNDKDEFPSWFFEPLLKGYEKEVIPDIELNISKIEPKPEEINSSEIEEAEND